MNRPAVEKPFPARISRSLTLGLGAIMLVLALVGGTSLVLAVRIFHNNEEVVQEYRHILRLEEIHSIFDDQIFELHQLEDATSAPGRTARARLMHSDLLHHLDEVAALHQGDKDVAHRQREQVLLDDLRRLADEAQALTERMAADGTRFTATDVEWLDRATHQVPQRVEEIADLHRSRITRLLEASQSLIGAILVLYVTFILVTIALMGAASVAVNRGIAAPLREMAHAAQDMAEAHFDRRIRVRFRNEIGQLANAFNVMADRLQARDHELQTARDDLERKAQEAQALYRISTDTARLHQVDRILQSVVDRSRELLHCDAAALCLFAPGQDDLVARATSGPAEAFFVGGDSPKCEPRAPEGSKVQCLHCPLIRPDYARARLAAALQLGDERIGTLYVTHGQEREFASADAELLAGLATQAALAIERARLAGELQSLAAVAERGRIAREMHDGLAQSLGLLHMKLQGALGDSTGYPAMTEALREMTDIARNAYEEARQSIFGLRTFVSRSLGLVATMTEYLHEFSAQHGIQVALEVTGGQLGKLPPTSEVQAVRIIQEALTNVRKHAAARHAWVRLQKNGTWLRVVIEDDGVGWDPQAPHSGDRLHFGLETMRERAEGLGGTLEIDTAPGRGTRVVARLPREAT